MTVRKEALEGVYERRLGQVGREVLDQHVLK